mmetsp:Transcript_15043/g.28448  ORF Transcript_15043/g.28448 Transcript_15043/m.28448 type:complete len:310 (-) Transcript_15043:134-1063(-)
MLSKQSRPKSPSRAGQRLGLPPTTTTTLQQLLHLLFPIKQLGLHVIQLDFRRTQRLLQQLHLNMQRQIPMLYRIRPQNPTDVLIPTLQRQKRLRQRLLPLLHARLHAPRPENVPRIRQIDPRFLFPLRGDSEERQGRLARHGGHFFAARPFHEEGHVDGVSLRLTVLEDDVGEFFGTAFEFGGGDDSFEGGGGEAREGPSVDLLYAAGEDVDAGVFEFFVVVEEGFGEVDGGGFEGEVPLDVGGGEFPEGADAEVVGQVSNGRGVFGREFDGFVGVYVVQYGGEGVGGRVLEGDPAGVGGMFRESGLFE